MQACRWSSLGGPTGNGGGRIRDRLSAAWNPAHGDIGRARDGRRGWRRRRLVGVSASGQQHGKRRGNQITPLLQVINDTEPPSYSAPMPR